MPLSRSEGHKPRRHENNSCGFAPSRPPLCHYLALPDSEGHKPKRNENNSWGVTKQHNKLLSNGPVLSIMVYKQMVRICRGGGGGGVDGPLTKATFNLLKCQGGKSLFQKWGIYCQNERFSSCAVDNKINVTGEQHELSYLLA